MSRDAAVRWFPLLPIPSDADLDRAIAVVDASLDRDALDAGRLETIVALQLNQPTRITARWRWVSIGWHPPND